MNGSTKRYRLWEQKDGVDQYELRLYSDFSSSDDSGAEEIAGPSMQTKSRAVQRHPSPSPNPPDSDSEVPIPSGRQQRLRRLQKKKDSKRKEKQPHRIPQPSASRTGTQVAGEKRKRRDPTMWDALAGRLNYEGFIPDTPQYASGRDTWSSDMKPMNFRYWMVKDASPFIKYTDFLERRLKDPKVQAAKPNNELMKALHVYISEFYARLPGGESSLESMWPDALMAFAVLLEETMAGKMEGDAWKAFLERRKDFNQYGMPVSGFFDWQASQLLSSVLDEEERRKLKEEDGHPPDTVGKFTRRSTSARGGRRRRCDTCFKAQKKCDLGHPCSRCVGLGRADQCQYETDSQSDAGPQRGSSPREILSCYRCYKAKRACDRGQPCGQCIKTGHANLCVYEGGSVRKIELSDKMGKYKSAAVVESETGSRASSPAFSADGGSEVDIDQPESKPRQGLESQEDESEFDESGESSEVDTGTVPYGRNPDNRPAAKKTGLADMPEWLRRAIGSPRSDDEDEAEEEDEENEEEGEDEEDDDIDPDDLEAQERRFARRLR